MSEVTDKLRLELMRELASIEVEGVFDCGYNDKVEMLIDGIPGFSAMSDKELIKYAKDNYIGDDEDKNWETLYRIVVRLEGELGVDEILLAEGV